MRTSAAMSGSGTTDTGQETAALHTDGALAQATFSPDGSLVAAAGDAGDAVVWRWKSGEQVAVLHEPVPLEGASFDPSGQLVALARRRRNRSALELARRARRRDPRRARLRLHRERRLQSRRTPARRVERRRQRACVGLAQPADTRATASPASGASLTSRSVRTDGSSPPSARMPRPECGTGGRAASSGRHS